MDKNVALTCEEHRATGTLDPDIIEKIFAKKKFRVDVSPRTALRPNILNARWLKNGYLAATVRRWEIFWCPVSERWYELDFSEEMNDDEDGTEWQAPEELRTAGLVTTLLYPDDFQDLVYEGYAKLVRVRMGLNV